MLTEMKKFLKTTKEAGLSVAVQNTLRYFNIYDKITIRFSCNIYQELPDSTRMGHPVGIVIHPDAEIGENVQIGQNVTIGHNYGDGRDNIPPTIGSDVTICAGACVIGNITIEKGAVIGANAVVLDDVEEDTTVVGVPAEKV